MTNKEYYDKVTGRIRQVYGDVEKLVKERDSLLNHKADFSAEYWGNVCEKRLKEIESSIKKEKEQAAEDVENIGNEFSEYLYSLDTLDPNAVNADANLLHIGVKLTERDISDMMNRNRENRTMMNIISRYAKENDIPIPMKYRAKEVPADISANVAYASRTVIKWADNMKSRDMMYDKVVGESSPFFAEYGSDD